MFRIPTHGLFLTCTENSFLFWTHVKSSWCIFTTCWKGNNLCTWKGDSYFMVRIPHPLRSLAWSLLPLRPVGFPHLPRLLPSHRAFISLHKDDINKPGSSVGHNTVLLFFLYMFLVNQQFIFSSVAPHRGVTPQPSAIPVGNPPEDWQSVAGWGDAGFEPGTAGQQSGALPLSHHASLYCIIMFL